MQQSVPSTDIKEATPPPPSGPPPTRGSGESNVNAHPQVCYKLIKEDSIAHPSSLDRELVLWTEFNLVKLYILFSTFGS